MSDYQVAYEESFRFESLIASLRLPDIEFDRANENENYSGEEEEGVWEGRTASMALVNAFTNCPESLEERILLRDEFGRRGLNEVIVVRAFLVGDQSISNAMLSGVTVYQATRSPLDTTRHLCRR
jgi:hypothetical protein